MVDKQSPKRGSTRLGDLYGPRNPTYDASLANTGEHEFMSCLKYEYITREWFLSPMARRVYRSSALLSMATFLFWLPLMFIGVSRESVSFARALLFVGATGAGITLIGMQFYLFRFDDSHPLKQFFWFCVMVIPFFGAPVYCFAVYSRATRANQPVVPAQKI
jgi:hypothetical protein